MLTTTSYGADGATFRQKFRRQGLFWFFQSLTAGYKLPGRVRQRATSLSAVQLVQGFCFCSLPYTFRYMFVNACAFSEPRARATAPLDIRRVRVIKKRSISLPLILCSGNVKWTTYTSLPSRRHYARLLATMGRFSLTIKYIIGRQGRRFLPMGRQSEGSILNMPIWCLD